MVPKAASYNLHEVVKHVKSGIVLVQEPWTHVDQIRAKLRGWKLFQGNRDGERPRACVYVTPDLNCHLMPMYSDRDVVSVKIKNVCRDGDSYILASAYMAHEEAAPHATVRELVSDCEKEKKSQ